MPIPVCILLIINTLRRYLNVIFKLKTKKEGSYILPSPNYYKQNQLKPRGNFSKETLNLSASYRFFSFDIQNNDFLTTNARFKTVINISFDFI